MYNSEFKIGIDSLRHDPKLVEAMSELAFNALDDDLRFQLSNIDAHLNPCNYYTEEEFNKLSETFKASENLSLFFNNCRSLKANSEALFGHLHNLNLSFDVVGLCETFVNDESRKLYRIDNYTAYHATRKQRTGGGIALYVKSELNHYHRHDLDVFVEVFLNPYLWK